MSVFKIAFQLFLYFQLPMACLCQNNNPVTNENSKKPGISDNTTNSALLIFKLHTKVRVLEKELNVYKNLKKIDSVQYGSDSLLIYFVGVNGTLLKKIRRKYKKSIPPKNTNTDRIYSGGSLTTYFNKNGDPDYLEIWDQSYDNKYQHNPQSPTDTVFYWNKIAYARYEYDDQNRLTKFVKVYSSDTVSEISISYDPEGNAIQHTKRIAEWNFWGDVKDVLKN